MFYYAARAYIRPVSFEGNDYNYLRPLIGDESQKNANMFIFPSKVINKY